MYRYRPLFLLLLFLFLSCQQQTTQTTSLSAETVEDVIVVPPLSESKISELDSLITRVMKNYRFNGNVLVALKGYPIYKYSNGYADLFKKTSLDYNTAFQLASVSKSFTAISVLMLKERGKLDLNDTLQKYIPEFPFDRITIKQLLQHTAGMQNYMYYVDQIWDDEKPLTNEDVLTLINANNPQLNFRPGRKHNYSNTGYAMLALLVERVSGKRFYKFVEDEIFIPLGMDNSFAWNSRVIDTISNIATGFTRRGWRYRKFSHDPLDEVLGDKSIYSTPEDLLKYDQALYSNKLVSDTLLQEAFAKTETRRGRKYNYGYGWRLKENNGKKIIYHNGLWNGFTSSLTRHVEDNLTIILVNNTNAPVASIVKQIYAVLDKELDFDEQLAENK